MNYAFANLLGIAVCGGIGGFAAWGVVLWLGLAGVGAAVVALLLGMVIATAAFTGGIALLRAQGWLK